MRVPFFLGHPASTITHLLTCQKLLNHARLHMDPLGFICSPFKESTALCFIATRGFSCVNFVDHGDKFLSGLRAPCCFRHLVSAVVKMHLARFCTFHHPLLQLSSYTFPITSMLVRHNAFRVKYIICLTGIICKGL